MKNYKIYLPGIVCLLISILLGLMVLKDYGVSWDEPIQRNTGYMNYNYIFKNDASLLEYFDKDYGVSFELPLIFIEKIFSLSDARDIFLVRHLATHLFFLLGTFCAYLLTLRLFKSQFLACLCFAILTFHPRLYVHSFVNSKDIPFLSTFLIAFFLSEIAFRKDKSLWFILLGLVCGYATGIRVMGMMLTCCFIFFLVLDGLKNRSKKTLRYLILFIIAHFFILILLWPNLWSDPVNNLIGAFRSFSHFRWEGHVLFGGQIIPATQLGWDYFPTWFAITTPELWLPLGFAGLLAVIVHFVKFPRTYLGRTQERNYVLYAACFLMPILAVIVFKSVLYDGWRHLFFVFPSFVLLLIFFVSKLLKTKFKKVVMGLCIVQLLFTAGFFVRNHPYQQVYFNHFVSHEIEYLRHQYELDYWGMSLSKGLNYILDHDSSANVRVFLSLTPITNNIDFLPAEKRKRIQGVDRQETPYYFLTNFRGHPEDYPYQKNFYEIQVLNNTILRVYKVEKGEENL